MDDVIYNETIATPGWELEFAVGTTYSLDTEALMAVALSFARLGEITDDDLRAPLRLQLGVARVNDRVALFCNRAGMVPPRHFNPLNAMLDKSVFEVCDDHPGEKSPANFHPKVWVIKEKNLHDPSKRQIKLVVLSRNLTRDTSLDVAATLTAPLNASPDEATRRKHAPLQEFLRRLATYANEAKRRRIHALVHDIDTLGRFELLAKYDDYDLIPIHFGSNLNGDVDLRRDLPGRRMAVVSPFLDAATLQWLNGYSKSDDKLLVTRLDSVTPQIMELYQGANREIWVMSPQAEINDIQATALHAKIYFCWGGRQGGVHQWLGSSNATHNGFWRNSEFMLRLRLKRGNGQFEDFKRIFCDEKTQLCEPLIHLPQDAEDDDTAKKALALEIRTSLLTPGIFTASAHRAKGGYLLTVRARHIPELPATVTVAPMQKADAAIPLSPAMLSGSVEIADASLLSEFYILTVTPYDTAVKPVSRVIKISTEGIPSDRDDKIFRSIVNTPQALLSYIEMMVTDRPIELAAMMLQAHGKGETSWLSSAARRSAALYESLLRTAAADPGRIFEIAEVVEKAPPQAGAQKLGDLLKVFTESIKGKGR